jgi:hypothetical protein
MRAEDFDQATIKELQAKANRCFDAAPSALDEPPHFLGGDERLRLMLEAQFYLAAVARKRDEVTARRDFRLEIAVIVLIGIEIVLSIFGIWLGFSEGRQQAKVLSNIADSTHDSVDAMKELRKEQAESLTAMNNTFGEAVDAMKSQLAILQTAQRAQLREQARKPAFELYVKTHNSHFPLGSQKSFPSEQAEYSGGTKGSIVLDLENTGDKDATNVKLSLMAESEYTLDCEQYAVERIPTPVEGGSTRILVNLGTIRLKNHKTVRCSASKPYVMEYVKLYFGVEADQLPAGGRSFPPIMIVNTHNPDIIRSLPQ